MMDPFYYFFINPTPPCLLTSRFCIHPSDHVSLHAFSENVPSTSSLAPDYPRADMGSKAELFFVDRANLKPRGNC